MRSKRRRARNAGTGGRAAAPEGPNCDTAQGFECDCVGVLVGPDLVYRTMDGRWVGHRDRSHVRVVRRTVTGAELNRAVRSIYRVLPLSALVP